MYLFIYLLSTYFFYLLFILLFIYLQYEALLKIALFCDSEFHE